MNKLKTYKDLLIWQKSMVLVKQIYLITPDFPESEKFGLTSQLHRSVISIPSNITEGFGRNSRKDFLRFLNITIGSLFESKAYLQIAMDINVLIDQIFPNYMNYPGKLNVCFRVSF